MTEHASALAAWESFYVIVGSSGGALIGLQFVVITLIADRRNFATAASINAFGTPTVVHFAFALLVSALMSAPWPTLGPPAVTLAVCGLAGLAYCGIVVRRARRQKDYALVGEDWVWYVVLPCVSYAALTVAAAVLRADHPSALFGIAAAALGLLFIGIHNAWDSVMHIVVTSAEGGTTKP